MTRHRWCSARWAIIAQPARSALHLMSESVHATPHLSELRRQLRTGIQVLRAAPGRQDHDADAARRPAERPASATGMAARRAPRAHGSWRHGAPRRRHSAGPLQTDPECVSVAHAPHRRRSRTGLLACCPTAGRSSCRWRRRSSRHGSRCSATGSARRGCCSIPSRCRHKKGEGRRAKPRTAAFTSLLAACDRDAALAIEPVGRFRRPAHQRFRSAAQAQQGDGVPARRRPLPQPVVEGEAVRPE